MTTIGAKALWFSGLVALATLATGGCATTTADETEPTLHRFTSGAEGFDTHSYYLDTGSEVVVFDAQFTPELATALLAEIEATTDSPVTHVVITHPNPDKFNGATVFQQHGAEVVASKETAAALADVHAYKKYYFVEIAGMFTNDTYPALATVDRTFDGSLDLELSDGVVVSLRTLEHAGVSSTQTVAYIPAADALVVGDLVHHKAHAWLEGGIVNGAPKPSLTEWKLALEELRSFGGATVYGGRGESAPVDVAVNAQIAYLDGISEVVSGYLATLEDPAAALGGDEAGSHYHNIMEAAAARFADYGLAYLVEYGVYGLAQSML